MSAEAQQNPKKTFMSKLVDLISSIFLPVLSVIMAAGVLKAFLLLLSALHLLSETSDTYYILSLSPTQAFTSFPCCWPIPRLSILAGTPIWPSFSRPSCSTRISPAWWRPGSPRPS